MSETFSIKIQGDSEGYVTFECPFCGASFKLNAGEYQDDNYPFTDLFCPYCGLTKEKDHFLSHEVIEQAQKIAENYMIAELNKAFKGMSKTLNKTRGPITVKMTYKPLKPVPTRELKDKDTVETEFQCACCEHKVKVLYCAGKSKVFCPYCGVDL